MMKKKLLSLKMAKLSLIALSFMVIVGSCSRTSLDIHSYGIDFFRDVYVPDDSTTYFIDCRVRTDSIETQVAKQTRKTISRCFVEHGSSVFVINKDTVINTVSRAVMTSDTFMGLIISQDGNEAVPITDSVFITGKMRDEIFSKYVKR